MYVRALCAVSPERRRPWTETFITHVAPMRIADHGDPVQPWPTLPDDGCAGPILWRGVVGYDGATQVAARLSYADPDGAVRTSEVILDSAREACREAVARERTQDR